MARSFSLVDSKLSEAAFFLEKMPSCGYNMFEMRCYLSAFVSSARTVTFSLQAVLRGMEGFDSWYKQKQEALKEDNLARFFHEFRTANQHIGDNPALAGAGGPGIETLHWFVPTAEIASVPEEDVLTSCNQYFVQLLNVVFECFLKFGPQINSKQRYTAEYFSSIGKTIEDAEEELGFPRGWTDLGEPDSIPYRWQLLRDQTSGCDIDNVFLKYLGKTTPYPELLP
ncbi:MAG: hypothetical protein H0X47_15190 [Nitrospirales bacterium]|nr:hypothetical protein [Nitrospirales bacterium]